MTDELLTPAEASAMLGVRADTLRKDSYKPAPRVAYTRTLRGHRRYRKSEIERVLRMDAVAVGQDPEWAVLEGTRRRVVAETEQRIARGWKAPESSTYPRELLEAEARLSPEGRALL